MPINYQPQPGAQNETLGVTAGNYVLVSATTANTKSGWNAIGSPSFSYEQVVVFMECTSVALGDFVADIGVTTGATGYAVVIQDLRLDSIARVQQGHQAYYIPVSIPAGTTIGARVSSNTTSGSVGVGLIGSSRGIRGAPGYAKCFAISTATLSRGISLFASVGAVNVEGAFTVITTNCPNKADAIFMVVGMAGDAAKTAGTSWKIDVFSGTSSDAAAPVVLDAGFRAETIGDRVCNSMAGPFPCSIKNGDVVQIRQNCSVTATADNGIDVMIYGLVP